MDYDPKLQEKLLNACRGFKGTRTELHAVQAKVIADHQADKEAWKRLGPLVWFLVAAIVVILISQRA